MSGLFPPCTTDAEFERVRRDDARLLPGVQSILAVEQLAGVAVERFAGGSLPVYALGDALVLKLYPPIYACERHTETAVLQTVEHRLAIPTPSVVASGELEGWGYLLMTHLRGIPLTDAWPDIEVSQRHELAAALGSSLAVLHALPAPDVAAVRIDWQAFIDEQRRTAVERQRKRGLADSWLVQIPDFLDRVSLTASRSDALLHTEIMREHLLVERTGDSWQLSGLFDFEPAMRGAAEYEFASIGLFFSCGDPGILRRLLRAYGYAPADLDRALERRLMAHALLHRYSNLRWYLERLPKNHGIATLDRLASQWWGVIGHTCSEEPP